MIPAPPTAHPTSAALFTYKQMIVTESGACCLQGALALSRPLPVFDCVNYQQEVG